MITYEKKISAKKAQIANIDQKIIDLKNKKTKLLYEIEEFEAMEIRTTLKSLNIPLEELKALLRKSKLETATSVNDTAAKNAANEEVK